MPEKMNPEIKAQWVKDLLSGEFEQGTDALCMEQGDGNRKYCCLGVLTHRAVLAGVVPEWVADHSGRLGIREETSDMYDRTQLWIEAQMLPDAVREWAGLSSDNPLVGDSDQLGVAELNDKGLTFAELADLIEEQL